MAKFEAHITLPRAQAEDVEKMAADSGWTYSAIDGDPVMGKQAYCYLTAYDTTATGLLARMRIVTAALTQRDVQVLREKIERIIFDTKTGVNEVEEIPLASQL
jgi:hypothetical protein